MGFFSTPEEDHAAHEAAYDEGREAAKNDGFIFNVVNGILNDMTKDLSVSEHQSYIQGYHDESTGQNPKPESES